MSTSGVEDVSLPRCPTLIPSIDEMQHIRARARNMRLTFIAKEGRGTMGINTRMRLMVEP